MNCYKPALANPRCFCSSYGHRTRAGQKGLIKREALEVLEMPNKKRGRRPLSVFEPFMARNYSPRLFT